MENNWEMDTMSGAACGFIVSIALLCVFGFYAISPAALLVSLCIKWDIWADYGSWGIWKDGADVMQYLEWAKGVE